MKLFQIQPLQNCSRKWKGKRGKRVLAIVLFLLVIDMTTYQFYMLGMLSKFYLICFILFVCGLIMFGIYSIPERDIIVDFYFRVEDSDDLVPIFNRQSSMLNQTYGDYFLAELIEAQDKTMQCVVAEVNSTCILMPRILSVSVHTTKVSRSVEYLHKLMSVIYNTMISHAIILAQLRYCSKNWYTFFQGRGHSSRIYERMYGCQRRSAEWVLWIGAFSWITQATCRRWTRSTKNTQSSSTGNS